MLTGRQAAQLTVTEYSSARSVTRRWHVTILGRGAWFGSEMIQQPATCDHSPQLESSVQAMICWHP